VGGKLNDAEWKETLEKEIDFLRTKRSHNIKILISALALIISLGSAGLSYIQSNNLTLTGLWQIGPWWVSILIIFQGIKTLFNYYHEIRKDNPFHIHIERDYLTPNLIILNISLLLGSIIAFSTAITEYQHFNWSAPIIEKENLRVIILLLAGILLIIPAIGRLWRFILKGSKKTLEQKLSERKTSFEAKYPRLTIIMKGTVDQTSNLSQESIKRTFSYYYLSINILIMSTGFVLIYCLWDSVYWKIAIPAAILFSSVITLARMIFITYNDIIIIDEAIDRRFELRKRIICNGSNDNEEIVLAYLNLPNLKSD